MFFRTLHFPTVYTTSSSGIIHTSSQCSLLLLILKSLLSNGLILVDEMGGIRRAISDAIQEWPPNYRKEGEEILIQLNKRNRFVDVPVEAGSASLTCLEPACRLALEIARRENLDLCLAKTSCCDCIGLPLAVDLLSYSASGAFATILNRGSVVLGDGEWDKSLFEANILHPVLRHAKHVKVIDRWVGRSLKWDKKTLTYKVAENYADALRWIFEQFVVTAADRYTTGFEVFCGIRAIDCRGREEKVAQALKRWADDCTNRYGYQMTIHVKLERPTQEMRHDRYLITDQIAIHVGRGVDLLRSDRQRVRDVTLGIVHDPGKIEAEVRSLQEVV